MRCQHILALLCMTSTVAVADRSRVEQESRPVAVDSTDEALSRSAAWLWARQGRDGGWHSMHYGLLESGQAYTPIVLHALMRVPETVCPRPAGGVERALGFMRRHVSPAGVLGVADPDLLEYPNYSTAYALQCFVEHGDDADRALIGRMTRYLVNEQYGANDGLSAGHVAYGAWGFGGDRIGGGIGHLDVAHTRRVLDALRAANGAESKVMHRAHQFLRVVQRFTPTRCGTPPRPRTLGAFDGGFYFSPVVVAANKGREHDDDRGRHFRSYATATCDGLLALLSAGVDQQDPRVQAGVAWLVAHPEWDYPSGIPRDHPDAWGAALHYYHLAVRSEVHARLGWTPESRAGLRSILVPAQHEDGHFENDLSHLMKEDDPILATTLATIALAHAR